LTGWTFTGSPQEEIRDDMRRSTLKDLNIRWWYWLVPLTFGAAGIGAFLVRHAKGEDSATLLVCCALFFTISLLGFLWPILRTREVQGAQFVANPSRRLPYRGIFIPTSNVKKIIAVIGGTVFGIGALLGALFGDTSEHKVKGAVAFVVYLVLCLMFLKSFVARKQGILLTDDGLVWNDHLFGTGLIPWSEIAEVRCYTHRENYSSPPSLGLRIKQLENVTLTRSTNRKLMENLKRWGWHCYYHSETVLLPLLTLQNMINFYKDHPSARWELVTGSALDKIAGFEPVEAIKQ
jgi:hypothetical protein